MSCAARIGLILFSLATAGQTYAAQSFPNKPVRLIVPQAPGGGADLLARVIAQNLGEKWAQQVVVDNRPGAGTIIATDLAAKSVPDGYTLMMGNIALAVNPALHGKLPYDAIRDLTPIIQIVNLPTVLAVSTALPANSPSELLTLAKKSSSRLSFGSSGNGSNGHIAGEMYSLASVMPHVHAGKLKALAVTDSKRSSHAPNIPTIGETLPGVEINNWLGILGPAGIQASLADRLNRDVLAATRVPQVRERLSSQGFDIQGGTRAEFAQLIRSDTGKYTKVIREAGLKAN